MSYFDDWEYNHIYAADRLSDKLIEQELKLRVIKNSKQIEEQPVEKKPKENQDDK